MNDQDQTDCCYETETDCAECKATETIKITCECVDTDCCNGSAEDNEDESVEHVLASEDCELEYLLTGDELEHNLNANLDISSYKPNQTISNVTNKINLKVSMPEMLKTSSIERPHSITPVNIDSFEAYLNQSLTPESKPNYDRLTITIPGNYIHSQLSILISILDRMLLQVYRHLVNIIDLHEKVIHSYGPNFVNVDLRVLKSYGNVQTVAFRKSIVNIVM